MLSNSSKVSKFVFYAFTPLHLFTSVYYAMQIKWRPGVRRYLIWYDYKTCSPDLEIFKPYFDDIFVITNPVGHGLLARQWIRLWQDGLLFGGSYIGKFLSDNTSTSLICFTDQNPNLVRAVKQVKKNPQNIVCLIEEGDATYAFPSCDEPPLLKKAVRTAMGISMGQYIGHTRLIDAWVVRHPDMLPKEKIGASTVIKQNNIFVDEEWRSKFKFLWANKVLIDNNANKKIIMWIGGPIEAHGVTNDEEILWLQEVADAVQNEFVIYIKLHPREKEDKFSRLIDHPAVKLVSKEFQWIPLEFIVNAFQPDVILTVSSSAAFHIYEMGFSGKVIYTYKRFERIQIDRNVIRAYSGKVNIFDVGSINELKSSIYDVTVQPRTDALDMNTNDDIRFFERMQNVTDCNDEQ